MKFVSFNINGIRAHRHQIHAIIDLLNPDIIGLQETKVSNNLFPKEEIVNRGFYVFQHGEKGKYGVALISKNKPIYVCSGSDLNIEEGQCRIIKAIFHTKKGNLTVLNSYLPQGENINKKEKFLIKKKIYQNLKCYIEKNRNKEPLFLLMGDMNISVSDLDIGIGEKNKKRWIKYGKCSFLPEERAWIKEIFNLGLVDTYRYLNPNNKKYCYSWFDYRSNGFIKNLGLRIDLILASKRLLKYVSSSGIEYSIRAMYKPSDHAPIWANFLV